MKLIKYLGLAFAFTLVGCVTPQAPVQLSSAVQGKSVVIVQGELPQAETQYTGNIGLLDYGIISATNSSLDKHLKALTFPEYQMTITTLEKKLKEKGLTISHYGKKLTADEMGKIKAAKDGKNMTDLTSYLTTSASDYVLFVLPGHLGTTRPYYGPVPTAEPVAVAAVTIQLIDVKTKELKWYSLVNATNTIAAPWDEEAFPNLTNAVYKSVNDLSRMLDAELSSGNTASKIAN
jgi:hypothetical protein